MSDVFRLANKIINWQRLGPIIDRGKTGEFDSSVTGDPCIIWDDRAGCYRMFYFAQQHRDGKEVNQIAQAVKRNGLACGAGAWQKRGPILYRNPQALRGDAHKPWILMDPFHPNTAAKVGGKYWLFMVVWHGTTKIIQAATAPDLSSAWTVIPEPVLCVGDNHEFDGYHVDTVTAYWFEDRGGILLFYKGYPRQPQPDTPRSPFGSRSACAVLVPGERQAQKIGPILLPHPSAGHWTAGWIGGLQLFPAQKGGWFGLINASPNPPASIDEEAVMREPAPSQGGWAFTASEWPVSKWEVDREPIEWVKDIPANALRLGESTNMWRHHILITPGYEAYLYYNSGPYGQERLFGKHAVLASECVSELIDK